MKIKKEHYDFLNKEINKVIVKFPNLYYRYKKHGLSDTRYNWDLFHMAKLTPFACSILYSYLNDDHINTALRKITGKKD